MVWRAYSRSKFSHGSGYRLSLSLSRECCFAASNALQRAVASCGYRFVDRTANHHDVHDGKDLGLAVVLRFRIPSIREKTPDDGRSLSKASRRRCNGYGIEVARLKQIIEGLIFFDVIDANVRWRLDRQVLGPAPEPVNVCR